MEEEWNQAITLNKSGNGHPLVSIYFNTSLADPFDADPTQIDLLSKFKSTVFDEYQALATNFNGTRKFTQTFRRDLINRLLTVARGKQFNFAEEFKNSSIGLLSCPQTLQNGTAIPRPELQSLLYTISSQPSSTTLVLGDPGSGKSALLATLGHVALAKDGPS